MSEERDPGIQVVVLRPVSLLTGKAPIGPDRWPLAVRFGRPLLTSSLDLGSILVSGIEPFDEASPFLREPSFWSFADDAVEVEVLRLEPRREEDLPEASPPSASRIGTGFQASGRTAGRSGRRSSSRSPSGPGRKVAASGPDRAAPPSSALGSPTPGEIARPLGQGPTAPSPSRVRPVRSSPVAKGVSTGRAGPTVSRPSLMTWWGSRPPAARREALQGLPSVGLSVGGLFEALRLRSTGFGMPQGPEAPGAPRKVTGTARTPSLLSSVDLVRLMRTSPTQGRWPSPAGIRPPSSWEPIQRRLQGTSAPARRSMSPWHPRPGRPSESSKEMSTVPVPSSAPGPSLAGWSPALPAGLDPTLDAPSPVLSRTTPFAGVLERITNRPGASSSFLESVLGSVSSPSAPEPLFGRTSNARDWAHLVLPRNPFHAADIAEPGDTPRAVPGTRVPRSFFEEPARIAREPLVIPTSRPPFLRAFPQTTLSRHGMLSRVQTSIPEASIPRSSWTAGEVLALASGPTPPGESESRDRLPFLASRTSREWHRPMAGSPRGAPSTPPLQRAFGGIALPEPGPETSSADILRARSLRHGSVSFVSPAGEPWTPRTSGDLRFGATGVPVHAPVRSWEPSGIASWTDRVFLPLAPARDSRPHRSPREVPTGPRTGGPRPPLFGGFVARTLSVLGAVEAPAAGPLEPVRLGEVRRTSRPWSWAPRPPEERGFAPLPEHPRSSFLSSGIDPVDWLITTLPADSAQESSESPWSGWSGTFEREWLVLGERGAFHETDAPDPSRPSGPHPGRGPAGVARSIGPRSRASTDRASSSTPADRPPRGPRSGIAPEGSHRATVRSIIGRDPTFRFRSSETSSIEGSTRRSPAVLSSRPSRILEASTIPVLGPPPERGREEGPRRAPMAGPPSGEGLAIPSRRIGSESTVRMMEGLARRIGEGILLEVGTVEGQTRGTGNLPGTPGFLGGSWTTRSLTAMEAILLRFLGPRAGDSSEFRSPSEGRVPVGGLPPIDLLDLVGFAMPGGEGIRRESRGPGPLAGPEAESLAPLSRTLFRSLRGLSRTFRAVETAEGTESPFGDLVSWISIAAKRVGTGPSGGTRNDRSDPSFFRSPFPGDLPVLVGTRPEDPSRSVVRAETGRPRLPGLPEESFSTDSAPLVEVSLGTSLRGFSSDSAAGPIPGLGRGPTDRATSLPGPKYHGSLPLISTGLATVSAAALASRERPGEGRSPESPARSPEKARDQAARGQSSLDLEGLAAEMTQRILRRLKREKERRGFHA